MGAADLWLASPDHLSLTPPRSLEVEWAAVPTRRSSLELQHTERHHFGDPTGFRSCTPGNGERAKCVFHSVAVHLRSWDTAREEPARYWNPACSSVIGAVPRLAWPCLPRRGHSGLQSAPSPPARRPCTPGDAPLRCWASSHRDEVHSCSAPRSRRSCHTVHDPRTHPSPASSLTPSWGPTPPGCPHLTQGIKAVHESEPVSCRGLHGSSRSFWNFRYQQGGDQDPPRHARQGPRHAARCAPSAVGSGLSPKGSNQTGRWSTQEI